MSKDLEADDERFQNPENQLVALRKFCIGNDFEIFREYVDKATGADPNRPELLKMLEHAENGLFGAIIVWKLDRLGRGRVLDILTYVERLKKVNVGLISMTERWLDTREDNPISELIISIMAWFAAEERRKISERTKLAIAKKKEEGVYRGGKRGKDRKPRRREGYLLRWKKHR